MEALERTQYQAALAVSGTWKGSNREKILDELGWETLHFRRYFRRLVMFYKILNDQTPKYLKDFIPRQREYYLRSAYLLPIIPYRTVKYKNSFFPDSITSWNNIGPELKDTNSLSIFKRNMLKLIRPVRKEVFDIHSNHLNWIFQLRVGLSPLKSHKKRHNFLDTPSSICACAEGDETTIHFLLKCTNFTLHREKLLRTINGILLLNDMIDIGDSEKVSLLLYGNKGLNVFENRIVLKATIDFIQQSGCFSWNNLVVKDCS